MKCTKFVSLLALLVVALGAGCKRNPQGTTPLPGYGNKGITDPRSGMIGDTAGINDGNTRPTEIGGGPLPENLAGLQPDPNQPAVLRDNTVFFAYDSADIRPAETSKLEAIASYMKSGNRAIRIEGHADERGTEEYNRSLGERRALAAREFLVRAGVSGAQIDTRTLGEDNPAVPGRTESAWAKNRRDEFILLQAPGGVGAANP